MFIPLALLLANREMVNFLIIKNILLNYTFHLNLLIVIFFIFVAP